MLWLHPLTESHRSYNLSSGCKAAISKYLVRVLCPLDSNGRVQAFARSSPARLSAVHLPVGLLNHIFKHLHCGGCLEASVRSAGKSQTGKTAQGKLPRSLLPRSWVTSTSVAFSEADLAYSQAAPPLAGSSSHSRCCPCCTGSRLVIYYFVETWAPEMQEANSG